MRKKVEKRKKIKWRGVFNLAHSIKIMYGYAYTEAQAKNMFCRRIADDMLIDVTWVMHQFNGSKPNYRITVE